jgi:hypothetical protein
MSSPNQEFQYMLGRQCTTATHIDGGLTISIREIYHIPEEKAKTRAQICKRLRRPGIDTKESIPPTSEMWRADTSKRIVVPPRQAGNRFLGS